MPVTMSITPNAQDIAALSRMFDRLRTEGGKAFVDAVAWTAWYVGVSIGKQTRKARDKKRTLNYTTPGHAQILELASKTGRTPAQTAGYWKYYVQRFTRKGDGSMYSQLLNIDSDLNRATEIRHIGYSKKTWRWMAGWAKRKADKAEKYGEAIQFRNPLEPGYLLLNKVPWMSLITGNLSGVFGSAERNMAKYFERQAAKAAKAAGAK